MIPEPCYCGALDCQRCRPMTYWMAEAADALYDLCLSVGDKFEHADKAGFQCELTANPSKHSNGVDWRLTFSGTAQEVERPEDVDGACLDALEDVVAFLKGSRTPAIGELPFAYALNDATTPSAGKGE